MKTPQVPPQEFILPCSCNSTLSRFWGQRDPQFLEFHHKTVNTLFCFKLCPAHRNEQNQVSTFSTNVQIILSHSCFLAFIPVLISTCLSETLFWSTSRIVPQTHKIDWFVISLNYFLYLLVAISNKLSCISLGCFSLNGNNLNFCKYCFLDLDF
jgi:hypothetical protein